MRIPKEQYELYDVNSDLKNDIEMDEVRTIDQEENIKELKCFE